MSWLGNLGGVERDLDGRHDPAKVEARIALERLARRIEGLERLFAGLPGGKTIITNPPDITVSGVGPYSFSYPFVLAASTDITHGGVNLFPGSAYIVTGAEMHCDPYDAPTADTIFTIQNDASAPTSSGTVTFATGDVRAENLSMAINFSASQRLYIKTPSNLNGMQNLYHVLLHWAPEGTGGFKP